MRSSFAFEKYFIVYLVSYIQIMYLSLDSDKWCLHARDMVLLVSFWLFMSSWSLLSLQLFFPIIWTWSFLSSRLVGTRLKRWTFVGNFCKIRSLLKQCVWTQGFIDPIKVSCLCVRVGRVSFSFILACDVPSIVCYRIFLNGWNSNKFSIGILGLFLI